MELAPPEDDRVSELRAGSSLPEVKEFGGPPDSGGGLGGGGP